MNRFIWGTFALIMLLGSCATSKNTEKIAIASEKGDCVGVAPMKCLLVKYEGQQQWEFFYGEIEGFNYEPGYEYVIEIKKETIESPAADQSSIRYIFVKELSKVQKTSIGMPQIPNRETSYIDSTLIISAY